MRSTRPQTTFAPIRFRKVPGAAFGDRPRGEMAQWTHFRCGSGLPGVAARLNRIDCGSGKKAEAWGPSSLCPTSRHSSILRRFAPGLTTGCDLVAALGNALIAVAITQVCIGLAFGITDAVGHLRVRRLAALFRQTPGCAGTAKVRTDGPRRGGGLKR